MTNPTIAFYSPLKPPDHEIPSGDRLMARLLIDCIASAGYQVDVASRLRAFVKDSSDEVAVEHLKSYAQSEIQRLTTLWTQQRPPVLWFCYHPYYKSPDLIGPVLSKAFDIPYVTAEASYSQRRTQGVWGSLQELVLASIKDAAVNICFTQRDKLGLHQGAPTANLVTLRPFIDMTAFVRYPRNCEVPHLVTVAMMRSGDKMNSYIRLAAALEHLLHMPWTLSVIGDGPLYDDVQALFAGFPAERIIWHGRQDRPGIAALFARSSIYVWPGCGEAYGLAYLEAQAAGLPVVAYDTAGVPEVVNTGYSGILTPVGDDKLFAAAIARLLNNTEERVQMSAQAKSHVQLKHGSEQAGKALDSILQDCLGSNV